MSKILLILFSAFALSATDNANLPSNVHDALMPLDAVPSSQDLATVYSTKQLAVAGLKAIANDNTSETGIRLRAIRSMTQYSSAQVGNTDSRTTLENLIQNHATAKLGSDLLVLRASIEALGAHPDKDPADVDTIRLSLDHESRDIRTATARALRDLGNTNAITYLRARYQVEQVAQVRLAISDALRVLGSPTQ